MLKKQTFAFFMAICILLSAMPAFAVQHDFPTLSDDTPSDQNSGIEQYYNANIAELNTWSEVPQSYTICDVDDPENNKYTSLHNLLNTRYLFPGDSVHGIANDDNIIYLMFRGIDEEVFTGITDRFGTGSDADSYSFGDSTDRNTCYRNIILNKLNSEFIVGTGNAEGGKTNGSADTRPYSICDSKCVYTMPIANPITYDLDGGCIQYGENPTSINISNSERTLYTYVPIKEGCHFTGWYGGGWQDNGDGTVEYTYPERHASPINLTATYVNANTVKFVAGEDATINGLSSLIVEAGSALDVTKYVPQKEGFYFNGWFKSKNYSDTPVSSVTKFDIDCKAVLYAKWTEAPSENFLVHTQISANGNITADKTEADAGEIVTFTATPDEGYKLKEYQITDFTRIDMTIEAGLTVTENKLIMPYSNINVRAVFEKLTPDGLTDEYVALQGDVEGKISFDSAIPDDCILSIKTEEVPEELKTEKITSLLLSFVVLQNNKSYDIDENQMTISVILPEEMQGFDNYSVSYINNIGEPTEKQTATVNGNVLQFTTNHLSDYLIEASKHEHDFGTSYKSDANGHWQECDCGEKTAVEPHEFNEWVITKEPTTTEPGEKERICSVCGFKETQTIEPLVVTYLAGDADNDTHISMQDVVLIQKKIASLVEFNDVQSKASDVDGDAKTTMMDVVLIQKYIAELIKVFPIDEKV